MSAGIVFVLLLLLFPLLIVGAQIIGTKLADRRLERERNIILAVEGGARTGREIAALAGIKNLGTVYFILGRLEESGEVIGSWGPTSETRNGFRRRYYARAETQRRG